MNKLRIITDEPTPLGLLDFPRYSKGLSDIIENSDPRFSIGIFGPWGTGKTTLMKMIEHNLKQNTNKKIVTVWFDAWKYEREQHLAVVPLMRTIRMALEGFTKTQAKKERSKWQKVKSSIDRTAEAFVKTTTINYGVGEFKLVEFLKTLKINNNIDSLDAIYYHAFDHLSSSLQQIRAKDPENRIVIFIDDLDRCSPEKALEVLESIKSFFDFEGIIFVIGLNLSSIDHLIKLKFSEKSDVTGTEYIKKIVQLPFQIPVWHEGDIRKYIEYIVDEKIKDNEFYENKDLLSKAVEFNPREVKRFINNLVLSRATFNKPIGNLIAVQALAFKRDWNWFFHLIMNNDSQRQVFLKEYKLFKQLKDGKPADDKGNILTFGEYIPKDQSLFFENTHSLRVFLDSGAIDKLIEIPNFEEYRRALESPTIEEEALTKGKLMEMIVNENVGEFNRFRSEHPFVRIDFSMAHFDKKQLSGINLSGVNLTTTDLYQINLSRSSLVSAKIPHSNLSEANLSGANLSKANLFNSDFMESNLSNANLSGVNLINADLMHANLRNVKFVEANLTNANISGANLSGATLYNTTTSEIKVNEETSTKDIKLGLENENDNEKIKKILKDIAEPLQKIILRDNEKLRQVYST